MLKLRSVLSEIAVLFDAYLFVDWSASAVPGPPRPRRDSLWLGEGMAGETGASEVRETYFRTRAACFAALRERLIRHREAGLRVLIGMDFAYGYPAGYARALGLNGPAPPWVRLWNELAGLLQDDDRNRNNRFQVASELNARCGGPGPLWGCPAANETPALRQTSPGFPYPIPGGAPLGRFRLTDRRARRVRGSIQEAWKLCYPGSVGGQILTGIPYLSRLRFDPALSPFSRVWPFETGFTYHPAPETGPFILHAEIWPGTVAARLDPTLPIRDQAQVRAMVHWAAEQDTSGALGRWFGRPSALTDEEARRCMEEESWILGV